MALFYGKKQSNYSRGAIRTFSIGAGLEFTNGIPSESRTYEFVSSLNATPNNDFYAMRASILATLDTLANHQPTTGPIPMILGKDHNKTVIATESDTAMIMSGLDNINNLSGIDTYVSSYKPYLSFLPTEYGFNGYRQHDHDMFVLCNDFFFKNALIKRVDIDVSVPENLNDFVLSMKRLVNIYVSDNFKESNIYKLCASLQNDSLSTEQKLDIAHQIKSITKQNMMLWREEPKRQQTGNEIFYLNNIALAKATQYDTLKQSLIDHHLRFQEASSKVKQLLSNPPNPQLLNKDDLNSHILLLVELTNNQPLKEIHDSLIQNPTYDLIKKAQLAVKDYFINYLESNERENTKSLEQIEINHMDSLKNNRPYELVQQNFLLRSQADRLSIHINFTEGLCNRIMDSRPPSLSLSEEQQPTESKNNESTGVILKHMRRPQAQHKLQNNRKIFSKVAKESLSHISNIMNVLLKLEQTSQTKVSAVLNDISNILNDPEIKTKDKWQSIYKIADSKLQRGSLSPEVEQFYKAIVQCDDN